MPCLFDLASLARRSVWSTAPFGFLPGSSAANKKAASVPGRLGLVLSMDMTGQGRVKRTHHQLPMFIELFMARIVSVAPIRVQANFLTPKK
jgi:hypothetical protein